MLHAGLDLSRKRIDVCLLSDQGELLEELACPPDRDGLRGLARRAEAHGEPVVGVIESMTGARFVHDTLESLGWAVEIADAPEETMARIFGVLESIVIGSVALGALLAPVLIATLGIRGALLASGALLPLLALLARPALARIDDETPPPTHALELLQGIPMFARLGPAPLEELATRLEPVRFARGEEIIHQGDLGDRFYMIEAGEVEVYEDRKFARREGPGDHFGEIALLRDVPRTATVVASSDVELQALERDDFIDAVTRDRLNIQAAESVVSSRLGSTRRRPEALDLVA